MSSLVPHVSEELKAARADLVQLRSALAEREVELADLRARLRAFETKYMRQVGVLYAALDEWEAKIAEREVDLYGSDEAKKRAEEQRAQAEATKKAAYADEVEDAVEDFDPPVSLKQLFREVAKRIHPDFARDESERDFFTRLMAKANAAYNRGDAMTLERMMDDHREVSLQGESTSAEMERVTRQVGHAKRDLGLLEEERLGLLGSEIAGLWSDAQVATTGGRDLLRELAAGLLEKVEAAEERFAKIDKQIAAHGK